MPTDPRSGTYYELVGRGPPLMIGLPLMASHLALFGEEARGMYDGWVGGLADGHRLCLIDYPGIGLSADMDPQALTPDRVAADLLDVADHAGFDRFAFFGYSWSGSAGLQLAARTDRLSALAVGGWPPLDPPHAPLLAAARARAAEPPASAMKVLRTAGQYRQWITWNAALLDWDGRGPRGRVAAPKLALYGAEGDMVEEGHPVRIASILRRTRPELEADGWEVVELPGYGHEAALHPEVVVPPLRRFLDRVLRPGAVAP